MRNFIRLHVRYDTPDYKSGDTRETININFGKEDQTPVFRAPEIGYYLLEWFNDMRGCYRDIVDGVPVAIPPSEWKAWAELTGRVVRPAEYAILLDMHSAWRAAMSEEINAQRERNKPPSP